MIPPARPSSPGFTLLEIMLVLTLAGLLLATVIPTLVPESPSGQANALAEQLLAACRQQHQQALLSGQDRGLRLLDHGYQWLQFREGSWQAVGNKPEPLARGVRLQLEPGESLWQEMLWLEQQYSPRLGPRASDSIAAGADADGQASELPPGLVFRATGDLTPARLTITAGGQKQVLVFEEQGRIHLDGEASRNDH